MSQDDPGQRPSAPPSSLPDESRRALNPIPEKELTMTLLMMPQMANFSGNVHGGKMLDLLDGVAYACASRYSGRYVVTLSVDRVVFKQPIHVGELVTFLANVNDTGRTSMEVGIKVVTENPREKTCRHAMTCYFTMVALDDDRRPAAVPPVLAVTEKDKRRQAAAKVRKEIRKEIQARYEAIRTGG